MAGCPELWCPAVKVLVIAEKPSVARDIVDALPESFAKEEAYFESDDTIVTFAVGHLVELVDPEAYDERFKKWRMDDLPIVPEHFELEPRDAKSKKQLTVIHKLMKRDDVDRIVNACDAGREGELIFSYIYELAGVDKPVDRLWISSMTKQAIGEGFARLRPGEQLQPLEAAARSRSEADWLVGMNATRAATIRGRAWVGGVVSLGRVQTPTLAMIVRREQEIQAFVSSRTGSCAPASSLRTWACGSRATRRASPSPAARRRSSTASPARTASSSRSRRNSSPSARRCSTTWTSLQRDANRKFSFSARRTLQVAQSLYEGKKAITYPRTSSRYLSGDMVPQLKPTAETLLPIAEYRAEGTHSFVIDLPQLPLGRVINDAGVSDHHAIIPTDVEHDMSDFSPDEKRIFDLVARRFLSVFRPPARYERTTVVTLVEEERFRTRGKVTLDPGWRAVYGLEADEDKAAGEENENAEIPPLEKGQTVRCAMAELRGEDDDSRRPATTRKRRRLLSAMETAGKLIDDEELREAMKESGLGTPATRAETIEVLIRREYIERAGKELQRDAQGECPGDHDARSAQASRRPSSPAAIGSTSSSRSSRAAAIAPAS